ncbi:MAG: hypothetical protein SXV54_01245 [Chloroflexota bacterium]|nr:hypothetical protein [Chloroflexota bacterium]
MEVDISVHGPMAGKVVRLDTTIRLKPGDTLARLLSKAGKQAGVNLLKIIRKGHVRPVVMLCGESLTLPDDLERPLAEGDKVTVLQALGGG